MCRDSVLATTHLHVQFPHNVVGIYLCVPESESEGSVLLRAHVGPVSLTLLPQVLLEVGYHGNSLHPLLPDQPPEVGNGSRERSCTHRWGHVVGMHTGDGAKS